MFSNLGPLFKATFRQAEQADTRMAIRKEDPRDQGRKKGEREDQEDSSDLWEDTAGVSVEALRAFLINFVEGRTQAVSGAASAGETGEAAASGRPPEPEIRTPQNTQTARAMQAYQSQAEKSGQGHHTPAPPAPQSDVDLVQAQDVRTIHALIADLKILSEGGVETLTLEKADTFLHSLEAAVRKATSGQ